MLVVALTLLYTVDFIGFFLITNYSIHRIYSSINILFTRSFF